MQRQKRLVQHGGKISRTEKVRHKGRSPQRIKPFHLPAHPLRSLLELSTVVFEFGFSELQDREIQKLNALATLLKQRDALTLGIVGAADRRMDRAAIMGESPEEIPPGDDSASEDETPVEPVTGQAEDDDRLEKLAQRRAEKVSAYLIEQAGVDAARIHVKPVQIKPVTDGEKSSVEFSLSVE